MLESRTSGRTCNVSMCLWMHCGYSLALSLIMIS